MSKRVAGLLRGHARVLQILVDSLEDEVGWGRETIKMVVAGVMANLRRDADDEEQRGKDWAKDPLRGYAVGRKRDLKEMGIEKPDAHIVISPRTEPWL